MTNPFDVQKTLTTLLEVSGVEADQFELAMQAGALLQALSGPRAPEHLNALGLSTQDGKALRKDLRDLCKRRGMACILFSTWMTTRRPLAHARSRRTSVSPLAR